MNEFTDVVQAIVILAAVTAPVVLGVRFLNGDEVPSMSALVSAPDAAAWPHGVQEEEPVSWHWGPMTPAITAA